VLLVGSRIKSGSEFQAIGPATENARREWVTLILACLILTRNRRVIWEEAASPKPHSHNTLHWAAPLPPKIVPSHVGIWTQCNTWMFGFIIESWEKIRWNATKWLLWHSYFTKFNFGRGPRSRLGRGIPPVHLPPLSPTVHHHFSKLSAEIEFSRSPICHSVYSRQHCNDLIDYRLLNMFAQTRCDVDKPGRRPPMTSRTCSCPLLSSASRNSWNCWEDLRLSTDSNLSFALNDVVSAAMSSLSTGLTTCLENSSSTSPEILTSSFSSRNT